MNKFKELENTLDKAINDLRALKSKTVLVLDKEKVRRLEGFILSAIMEEQHREKKLVGSNHIRESKERQKDGFELLDLIQESK